VLFAGERKTSYLEDIAILTGGTMVKEELGVTLDKADESVLGVAAKVVISKEACTIVGDGRTQQDVDTRVKQIRNLAEQTEQEYEKEKLNERIARLSGGVAIIQVRRVAALSNSIDLASFLGIFLASCPYFGVCCLGGCHPSRCGTQLQLHLVAPFQLVAAVLFGHPSLQVAVTFGVLFFGGLPHSKTPFLV
jgi:hypothetical protein